MNGDNLEWEMREKFEVFFGKNFSKGKLVFHEELFDRLSKAKVKD